MKKVLMLLAGFVLASVVYGQGPFTPVTASKLRSGTTLPATCSIAQVFFKTNATAGANIYGCTAANTWTVQTGSSGTGTVTSIATTSPITGGTITTTGTIACATCVTSAAALTSNALVVGGGLQATAALGSLGTTTTLLHGNAAGLPTFAAVVSADLNITTTTCTNQFLTAISATGTGTCTTDTLASAQHANQGTTTTVLHGAAAGNPSFASVGINDVSGSTGTVNFVFSTSPTITTPVLSGTVTLSAIKPPSDSTTAIQVFKADGTTIMATFDTTDGTTILGTPATSQALLTISTPNTTAPFQVRNSSNSNRRVSDISMSSNNGIFQLYDSSDVVQAKITTTGNSFINNGKVFLGSTTDDTTGAILQVNGGADATSFTSKGTKFTASGCSNGTLLGGATAGSFNSGTTGACTVVVTMGATTTPTTGWACSAANNTTTANLYQQSATTTTTATFTGTTVSGDVIRFHCMGY